MIDLFLKEGQEPILPVYFNSHDIIYDYSNTTKMKNPDIQYPSYGKKTED